MISDHWTLNHLLISQLLVVSVTLALLRELPYLTVAVASLFNEGLPFLTECNGYHLSRGQSLDEISLSKIMP